jgi:predicted nuclease of predicted toxin-antitoxin system
VTPRFLADENIPSSVIRWLESQGYDTKRTTEAPGPGAPDLAIIRQARRNSQLILTLDQDFVRLYRQLESPFGVVVVMIRPATPSRIEELMNRFLSKIEIERHSNSLILVSEKEIRIEARPI